MSDLEAAMRKKWGANELGDNAPFWLVVGNGPSRELDRDLIRGSFPKVACNSGPAFDSLLYSEDWLVCYDREQAVMANVNHRARLILCPVEFSERTEPIRVEPEAIAKVTKDWQGPPPYVGNLSGYIAFQHAVVMGAKRICLVGMDVGGIAVEQGLVRLSASDDSLTVPESACIQRAHGLLPYGWTRRVQWWGNLIDWAEARGTEVALARAVGALAEFVPTAEQRWGAGWRS